MTIKTIAPSELYDLSTESAGGLAVIDVRETDKYATLHAVIGASLSLGLLSRGELGFLASIAWDAEGFPVLRKRSA